MCMLCVVQRSSRRVATMLPWLVASLVVLWAFSQFLPPGLRFEITSPQVACVLVLLATLFWYEVLMPKLSDWRSRRAARLRERQLSMAIEMQKRRKTATRRCRNCNTPYRDQNPGGGGRFMCSCCGHVSKRPILDIPEPETPSGIIGRFMAKGCWLCGGGADLSHDDWRSGTMAPPFWKLASNLSSILSWSWRKTFRIGTRECSSVDLDQGKGENGGNLQESREEKARRKVEEKQIARREKMILEEEERKQREEVARLVEERRRLRDEILEAEKKKKHSKSFARDRKRDDRRDSENQRLGKHKEAIRESERKNEESDRKHEAHKNGEKEGRDAEVATSADDHGLPESKHGHGANVASNKPNKYFDRMKGSFFGKNSQPYPPPKSSKSSTGLTDSRNNSPIKKDTSSTGCATSKVKSNGDHKISANPNGAVTSPDAHLRPPAPKKSWLQLFTRSSTVFPYSDTDPACLSKNRGPWEAQSLPLIGQNPVASYTLENDMDFTKTSPMPVYSSKNSNNASYSFSTTRPLFMPFKEQMQNSLTEEADDFEDPCYIPDPLMLLGPVSSSLDTFPWEVQADPNISNKMEDTPILTGGSISAGIVKPSPVKAPISRSRTSGERSSTGPDESSSKHDQSTWQPWGPPRAQDAFCLAGAANCFTSIGQEKSKQGHVVGLLPRDLTVKENYAFPGICSPNIYSDNIKNGELFAPLSHNIAGSAIWSQHGNLHPTLVDGECYYPPIGTADGLAQNELAYNKQRVAVASHPLDLSHTNLWSQSDRGFHAPPPAGSYIGTGPHIGGGGGGNDDVGGLFAPSQQDAALYGLFK